MALPSAGPHAVELAELLEQSTVQVQGGEVIDWETLEREHPDYVDELRKLLPAVELLANLSCSGQAAAQGPSEETRLEGILGDFRLIRELGRGGMVVVYEAEQLSLRRRVALKVLPFAGALDPRQLQWFQIEARAAACLHHQHIIPVFAVDCERGVHFYAMQLIAGANVATAISARRQKIAARGAPGVSKTPLPVGRIGTQGSVGDPILPYVPGPDSMQEIAPELSPKRSRLSPRYPKRLARSISVLLPGSGCRWPMRWRTRTNMASCTVMSSRASYSWTSAGTPGSPILVWPSCRPTNA